MCPQPMVQVGDERKEEAGVDLARAFRDDVRTLDEIEIGV